MPNNAMIPDMNARYSQLSDKVRLIHFDRNVNFENNSLTVLSHLYLHRKQIIEFYSIYHY
jgi:hypothetical protein